MAQAISFAALVQDSLARTRRLILPSLPFAIGFTAMLTLLVWAASALPDGNAGFMSFSALALVTLYAHSLFSSAMYRAVLPAKGSLAASAWSLSLSWLLMSVVVAIIGAIIVLFFSLVGTSLGVAVSDEAAVASGEVVDISAQMRDSGVFIPMFALFIAVLLWFYWFAVRIMCFASATVARNAVHVFRSWYWTKGCFRVLGPTMLALVVIPLALLGSLGALISNLLIGPSETSAQAALSTGLMMLILLPSAWLGHGFAAAVYDKVAPELDA